MSKCPDLVSVYLDLRSGGGVVDYENRVGIVCAVHLKVEELFKDSSAPRWITSKCNCHNLSHVIFEHLAEVEASTKRCLRKMHDEGAIWWHSTSSISVSCWKLAGCGVDAESCNLNLVLRYVLQFLPFTFAIQETPGHGTTEQIGAPNFEGVFWHSIKIDGVEFGGELLSDPDLMKG